MEKFNVLVCSAVKILHDLSSDRFLSIIDIYLYERTILFLTIKIFKSIFKY